MASLTWLIGTSFWFLYAASCCSACQITIDNVGAYTLGPSGDSPWLKGGPFSFLFDSKWRSTDDGTLNFTGPVTISAGKDELSQYNSRSLKMAAGGVSMVAEVRTYPEYPGVVIFIQRFPQGLLGSRFEANKTNTAFPTFQMTSTEADLGYLSYGGMMLGDYAKSFGM
ncbi:uncharacterized protein LOC101858618 [Aplysia californica]|uniref:Uncharacterized protein LOC101858618 n=1 Tax=Aplysia californica TaxID=6500 RepID=A0ABM0JJP6_APLCA|nr:uncharacterized protein LOC101858618 [Aplysia californica]